MQNVVHIDVFIHTITAHHGNYIVQLLVSIGIVGHTSCEHFGRKIAFGLDYGHRFACWWFVVHPTT